MNDINREGGLSDDEIRQIADEFMNEWFPKWDKYCEICKARNCKNNDSCIQCGCQF